MGQEPTPMLDEIAELKAALEQEWPSLSVALRASGTPLNEGDGDGDGDGGADGNDGDGAGDGAGDDAADDDANKTFDADYVKKLRDEAAKHRRDARDAKAKIKEFEDATKSDAEKLEERATSAETKASAAERELARMRVALKKGLTEAQAKRLIGDTEAELEADADELLTSFKPAKDEQDSSSRRPRERLRPGAVPSAEEEENDPAALAAKVPRRYA